ncbi:DNA/RNA non-specific endonuclease [bacterium]|nr:MAG: DNA/RNA non-specific endonuclease [bacterium]
MKAPVVLSRLCGIAFSCALTLALVSGARADNEHLLLGNPSNAKALAPAAVAPPSAGGALSPVPAADFANFLVEKPEFVLSYNRKNGGPNWVAWHLAQSDRGRSGRSENFRPDQTLPEDCQIKPTAYRGTGYDRGHQCPSGDRTSDAETNSATFLMSNMLPQAPDLNRILWNKFEEYCRDQLRTGANEEYIICGGVGSKATIADGKVNVPEACWKIVVVLPTGDDDLKRIDAQTRVIAINIPNDDAALAGKTWRDFLVSVDSIETATGYDFLSALPKDIQDNLEAKVDSGRAANAPKDAADG